MSNLKKGDKVKVMLGKDRGKEGTLEKVSRKDGKAFINGVNTYKRHVKSNAQYNFEGGIIDVVKPVDLSNVSLICPNCKKITRVGFEISKTGKVRICRKCHKGIDVKVKEVKEEKTDAK